MSKRDHTTSIRSTYTPDSRDAIQQAASILAEHYGIKLASLVKFTKSLNKHLPKEHRVSEAEIAKVIYGSTGSRQQVNQLLKKYGEVA